MRRIPLILHSDHLCSISASEKQANFFEVAGAVSPCRIPGFYVGYWITVLCLRKVTKRQGPLRRGQQWGDLQKLDFLELVFKVACRRVLKTCYFKILKFLETLCLWIFSQPWASVVKGGCVSRYPPRSSFHKWRCFRTGGYTWTLADKINYCNLFVVVLFTEHSLTAAAFYFFLA